MDSLGNLLKFLTYDIGTLEPVNYLWAMISFWHQENYVLLSFKEEL